MTEQTKPMQERTTGMDWLKKPLDRWRKQVEEVLPGQHHESPAPTDDIRAVLTQEVLAQTLGDADHAAAIQSWLLTMPDDEWRALRDTLTSFSKQAGIDLGALHSPYFASDDGLQQQVTATVAHYLAARWQAVQLAPAMSSFAQFQAWWSNPLGHEQRTTTSNIFAKLDQAGLLAAPPVTLMLSNANEREQFVREQLQAVGAEHPDKLVEVFRAVLDEASAPPPPADTPATPATAESSSATTKPMYMADNGDGTPPADSSDDTA